MRLRQLWEDFKQITGSGTYPNCRCCHAPIERNGCGIFPLGLGFCIRCVSAILGGRKRGRK